VTPTAVDVSGLFLLGSFELRHGGQRLQVAASAERLLAFLAVSQRHRPVSRSALAERLWSEGSPARAASNLRSVLWRLPRPRGRQLVLSNASTVVLAPEVDVDLWHAQGLAKRLCGRESPDDRGVGAAGEAHDWDDALILLQEDLLPDWHDEWLMVDRESHRQRRLHALERSSVCLREKGHFNDALSAGLAAVHAEPLRESAHRRVIEVHLEEGNHAEALRQFDGYRRLLATELGLPPSPSIRQLVAPLLGRPVDTRRSRR
jgi:DNA-binding SARP family transcriptional activator